VTIFFAGAVGQLASLAEQLERFSPLALVGEIRGIVAGFPLVRSIPEQLLGRGLVAYLLGRVLHDTYASRDPEIVGAFFKLLGSPWPGDEWFFAFARLSDLCEAFLRNRNVLGRGHPSREARTMMALEFIESNYSAAAITLDQVAHHSGLSATYLVRTLKQTTGEGFVGHVRRCRLTAARHLLDHTVLTIKEIAAKVGYGTPRQLERDFKRLHGVTPNAYRRTPVCR
jgi:AraC-like DNA-binding protein